MVIAHGNLCTLRFVRSCGCGDPGTTRSTGVERDRKPGAEIQGQDERNDNQVVRPGVLTNGEKRGSYRHGPLIGSFVWPVRISRADVAGFMLNQLESDAYVGAAPGVCW